jgi:Uma2 family endonuclease
VGTAAELVLHFDSMSTSARRVHYTYAEYLALEEESSVRHEFLDGEIYAMAGGSPDHAALAATLIALVGPQLPPGCRVFTSDLRVRIGVTGLSTYPDAAVVCGRTLRPSEDPLAVVNPVLLIEITSPSTEDYDRGEKLRHYRSLASVREVLIVSHRAPRLTLHRREEQGWTETTAAAGDVLELASVAARVAVDDVYRDELEDA